MKDFISGLEPILPKSSKILILGSMPSNKSILDQQYYAHSRNTFWPIIFSLLTTETSNGHQHINYRQKVNLLYKHRIALWDVIGACERKGSLDSSIVIGSEHINPIQHILQHQPSIKMVFCNGQKSYQFFKRFISKDTEISISLPSTSPAHAAMSFDEKKAVWHDQISPFLY